MLAALPAATWLAASWEHHAGRNGFIADEVSASDIAKMARDIVNECMKLEKEQTR